MRLKALVIVASLVASAVPAMAQQGVEVHDHRKNRKPNPGTVDVPSQRVDARVTGFSPTTGPVGTVVTITGDNFVPQTKVRVGGRPVREMSITKTSIQFAIPRRVFDGVITLHVPGSGSALAVGTFIVQANPKIARFEPASGPVGTRVEILGEGFQPGDVVSFNGKSLATSELQPNRLVVVIPPGATTDVFTISRPSVNIAHSSRRKFEVLQAAPVVSGMAPTGGPPGTTVRITGSNFTGEDYVYWGKQSVKVLARTPTTMDVQVPLNARASTAFTIKGPGGNHMTAVFNLVVNPRIVRFTPEAGGAGTRVEVYGDNFLQGDQFVLAGRPLAVVSLVENKVTVEIPPGASSDRFTVMRAGQPVATSARVFNVLAAPTVASFAPTQGPAGTRVTIQGTNFTPDVKVMFGTQPLRLTARRSAERIEVTIPAGATTQPFTITTRAGSVSTGTSFVVQDYAKVVKISPISGPVGTRVTIEVNGFSNTERFFLGTVELPIVERAQNRSYTVTIPDNAKSGAIAIESHGGRDVTPWRFEVNAAPVIATISPTGGKPGSRVFLKGSGFTAADKVYFGSIAAKVVRRTRDDYVEVDVPDNATGTDFFYIENSAGKAKAPNAFTVYAPLSITEFGPVSGGTGTKFTIKGTGFTPRSQPSIGTLALPIVAVKDTYIVVTLPAGAKTDFIYVKEGTWTAKSTAQFQVVAAPTPPPAPPPSPPQAGKCELRLTPASGGAGANVTVTAQNCTFKNVTGAWHNGKAAQIVSTSAAQIVVKLPADASGTDHVTVEIDGGSGVKTRVRTEEKYTVNKY